MKLTAVLIELVEQGFITESILLKAREVAEYDYLDTVLAFVKSQNESYSLLRPRNETELDQAASALIYRFRTESSLPRLTDQAEAIITCIRSISLELNLRVSEKKRIRYLWSLAKLKHQLKAWLSSGGRGKAIAITSVLLLAGFICAILLEYIDIYPSPNLYNLKAESIDKYYDRYQSKMVKITDQLGLRNFTSIKQLDGEWACKSVGFLEENNLRITDIFKRLTRTKSSSQQVGTFNGLVTISQLTEDRYIPIHAISYAGEASIVFGIKDISMYNYKMIATEFSIDYTVDLEAAKEITKELESVNEGFSKLVAFDDDIYVEDQGLDSGNPSRTYCERVRS